MRSVATSVQLLFLVSAVFLKTCSCFETHEVWALTNFKEAIYEDPHLKLSNWNGLDENPCGWSGVGCSEEQDHVTKINISGSSLKGFLAPELSLLTYLQELILHGNNLIGTIPKELGMLKHLKVLDLGRNQLTGPIPREFGNLTSIVKLNLQSNGLTGRLPLELANLRNLQELRLDRNKLQGTLPASSTSKFSSNIHGMYASNKNVSGFCHSSQLKVADFSYNFFVGNVPKCLQHLPGASFQGNCLEDKDLKHRSSSQCAGTSHYKFHSAESPKHVPVPKRIKHHESSKPTKPAWLLVLEIVTGVMVGCLLLLAAVTAIQRCKSKSSIIIPWKKSGSEKETMALYIGSSTDSEMLKDITRFSRQELEVACEDFSNIIGSSSDSLVYKGTLKGGSEIAVISLCIKEEQWTGFLELYFQKEVADLARITHENTGKLMGYCQENSPFTRMVVLEYASNGTLYEHLHYGEDSQLSWTRRMKIIIGIAHGLRYLHTELNPPFTISELNSNAVYLTEDFSPKLVDFESRKTILSRAEKYSASISSQGPICALPSSLEARHLDLQGNIYAFAVLLLEIISGRPPYCKEKGSLIDWASGYLELPEVMSHLVDPELKHFGHEDLTAICEVVNLCINPDATTRPTMEEVCAMLDSRIDTSISVDFKSSSLAWAELALAS